MKLSWMICGQCRFDHSGIKTLCGKTHRNKDILLLLSWEKLRAILRHLIENAIKYTDTGEIMLGCQKKDEFIEFFVKDTGIGIPNDRQKAIFERFVQADIADKDARQGAGLGLAIAQAYVLLLGGKIWLESKEGEGSTFYFTMPCEGRFPK